MHYGAIGLTIVIGSDSRIYSTSTVAPKFARFESSWLQRVGVLEEKVYKIRSTDLKEMKRRPRMECANPDHIVIAAAIRHWRCR